MRHIPVNMSRLIESILDRLDLFYIRFQEHFWHYKHKNGKSKFAQHFLGNKHSIGSMENIMEILRVTRKGKMMNTLERLNICIKTKLDNQINDKCTVKPNIIFGIVIQRNTNRGQSLL